MAFLSTGVDPNYGEYGGNIRAAMRHIIHQQDPATGYLPNSMYNHGFGNALVSRGVRGAR